MPIIRKPSITGDSIKQAVLSSEEKRPPLVEGLIHDNQSIMISSDTGAGKSTIIACMMAQASSGFPVFSQLFCPRPLVIYYIPFERGIQEITERFKHLEEAIPINYNNIYLNENFTGMNVINDKHADDIILNISKDLDSRKVDIIIIDPIYASVAGGLSTDEKASQFTRFSTRIMAEFKCSNLLIHHTSRDVYSVQGKRIDKDDPFYGSIWLKAHCNGGFYMKRTQETEGVTLFNKKDSQSVLLSKIPLKYCADSGSVFINGLDLSMPAKDRLLMAYRTFYRMKKIVTFAQIKGCVEGVSDGHLRALLRTPPFDKCFNKSIRNGESTLYTPTMDI